ncbi:TPA: hypothetical protein HA278_06745 [Candidatus Woesearchaeota archaeon]|nr:hypothetical protein [archaeon]MAG73322.1 hypothetical protein [archaeon]HIJ11730.1 hypothetical protein [Candidatus Woesearchaeota archaeon]|tara:strand:+ start:521 stop:748 length:228 start_codon:yes stop_codon:yes gene_type:complete
MTEANVQKEMLDTLTGLKQDVDDLKHDMHFIRKYLEDSRLTSEEKELVDRTIANVGKKNESNFVSHEDLKNELGL